MIARVPPDRLVLLDTNVLVQSMRGGAKADLVERILHLRSRRETPLLSSVVEAEIRQFAVRRAWGEKRMALLQGLLSNLVRVSAGLPEVVEAWVEIAVAQQDRGAKIGENDLWIAATARAAGAVLVTFDSDFLKLHPGLVSYCRIDENTGHATLNDA